jgi:alkanesulfonate monooxygenase SsuD/methylene tetrahydromethanopterin reductase-like flavin-dependent oxidoreductase (luciferase family)
MKPDFRIVCQARVVISDDFASASAPIRQLLALYIGGMGAKEQNFHKRFIERLGFAEEAQRIQDFWITGRRTDAATAVSDEMVHAVSLVGSKDQIRQRLKVYKAAPISTLCMSRIGSFEDTLRTMEFLANEVL